MPANSQPSAEGTDPPDAHSQLKALPQSFATDRRSRVRFPLDLAFSYRTLDRRSRYGAGHTLNISSTGVLVESRNLVTPGTTVELTAEWLALLDGWIPLYLVMTGTVV